MRQAIVTALTGLTQTGANVYDGRVLPLHTSFPALCVYINSEVANYDDSQGSCGVMREAALTVQGYHKGDDDDMLDQIALEVETALYTDQTFGALAQYLDIEGMEISREGDGEKLTGVIVLNYKLAYMAAHGSPDAAI